MTCHWCDLPETAHPVYRQIDGEHDYEPRIDEPPIARPDRPAPDTEGCRCATSERPGQCTCPPPNPLTGVHVDSPSDRLPWTDRLPETPSYQTGRVATTQPEPPPAPTMDDLNEAAPVLKAGGEALDNLVNPPRPRERWWRRILGSST